MATWEDVVCKARELVDAAGRKVVDVAEITKLKLRKAENERAICDAMEAIGRLVYEGRLADTQPEEGVVAELCRQINEYRAANAEIQSQLDGHCGYTTCECGTTNPQGAAFCNACGKEL